MSPYPTVARVVTKKYNASVRVNDSVKPDTVVSAITK
jgi:hypothetical protein